MLVVYKTGAIRVTPKFTRMIVAGMFGVVVLALGNFVLAMFGVGGGEGLGLRGNGPIAIIFSLVCIGLAAFSFLLDFDAADQMIRAGAPEKAAWGIALGLTVTLVWLYIEILRLLSTCKAIDGFTRQKPRHAGGFSSLRECRASKLLTERDSSHNSAL